MLAVEDSSFLQINRQAAFALIRISHTVGKIARSALILYARRRRTNTPKTSGAWIEVGPSWLIERRSQVFKAL
jgi:hypothetical protein